MNLTSSFVCVFPLYVVNLIVADEFYDVFFNLRLEISLRIVNLKSDFFFFFNVSVVYASGGMMDL